MIFIVSFLWLVIFAKKLFFWIWLWQLKEYHIGRFLDHFNTDKGKRLFLNPLMAVKTAVLAGIVFYSEPITAYVVIALFFLEFVLLIRSFKRKTLKIPVLTRKTSVILSAGVSFEFLVVSFLYGARASVVQFAAILLAFDLAVPLVSAFLILIFQPLAVAIRDQLIRKAERRMEGAENLMVVGVTGSYGKTSIKEFLAVILSKKYKVIKTKEHQNSEVGISGCIIDDLEDDHEVFVVEMGAYNKGGIKLLSDIVNPKIGILSGVNEQHMATFGSLQKTIEAKFELIEALPEDGLAILNYDDENIKKEKVEDHNHKIKNVKFYSVNDKNADIWAENVDAEIKHLSFKIKSKDGDGADFQLNLLGAHNISNVLAAAACAKYLGMSLSEISRACADIDPQQSGLQPKEGIDNLNVFDATYSANPTGVISHLNYLKLWPGKKIIIMPCLIELGRASKEVHRKIGRKIAEVCDLAIITTKDRLADIQKGADEVLRAGQQKTKVEIIFIEKPDEILNKIRNFSDPESAVLLESRVPTRLIKRLTMND